MYQGTILQFLLYFLCFFLTQAYFPKQLIPKRLRVKMCEKNPTLSICGSLIDSPKYIPFDQYSKWDICKFRTDLSFCQRFPVKLFATEFKNEEIIPLKPFESSRESNGFVEPITATEVATTTKVTKIFTSTKLTTLLLTTTTTTNTTEADIEGSGEDDEAKSTEALTEIQASPTTTTTTTTMIPVLQDDE